MRLNLNSPDIAKFISLGLLVKLPVNIAPTSSVQLVRATPWPTDPLLAYISKNKCYVRKIQVVGLHDSRFGQGRILLVDSWAIDVLFSCCVVLVLCCSCGVSWPSGLTYRTQVLVLAAECGFESRPWHLCPWARHLIIIASLHPGVKWVPVRAELVD